MGLEKSDELGEMTIYANRLAKYSIMANGGVFEDILDLEDTF